MMHKISGQKAVPFGLGAMGTEGTQSIQRALRVLKFAVSRRAGVTLTEVVQASGLTKPTVHRILAALVEEGFLQVTGADRTYQAGMEALAIGLLAEQKKTIRTLAEPSLQRLAAASQNTIYLSVPSGWDCICVDCVVGDYPIRILTLNIGDRRPLGVSAGGIALIAYLPPHAIDTILRESPNLPFPGVTFEDMRTDILYAQRHGYAFNPGRAVPEMVALGVPVFNREKQIIAALSMATLASRLVGQELLRARRLLEEEARTISEREYASRR